MGLSLLLQPLDDMLIHSLSLERIGKLHIKRASHVEPNPSGKWYADLAPVDGPSLGPFEHDWLVQNRLLNHPGL